VLSRTAELTRHGAGTCVGRPFPTIRLKIIGITDSPIAAIRTTLEVGLAHPGDRFGRGKGAPRRSIDRVAPGAGQPFHARRDLPDVRGGGADERRQSFPRILAQEPEPEEREESRNRSQLLRVLEVNPGILVETQIAPD